MWENFDDAFASYHKHRSKNAVKYRQVTEQRKMAFWIFELAKWQSFVNIYAASLLLDVSSKNSWIL